LTEKDRSASSDVKVCFTSEELLYQPSKSWNLELEKILVLKNKTMRLLLRYNVEFMQAKFIRRKKKK